MNTIVATGVALAALAAAAAPAKQPAEKPADVVRWELKLTEDFSGTKLNEKLWSRIDKGNPDWQKKMSLRPDLVTVKDGQLFDSWCSLQEIPQYFWEKVN